LTLLVWSYDL